jgi:hypothetical protein
MQTQLSQFYLKIIDDPRIGPVHTSLYGALFTLWEKQNFTSPLCLFSREVMPLCKISGSATYHRVIKELNEYGYLRYIPSYNHFVGSSIYLDVVNRQR